MKRLATTLTTLLVTLVLHAQVPLHWVGTAPTADKPVTLGIPFSQGELRSQGSIQIQADGRALDTDYWPLAYWPDGSIKWAGVAAVIPGGSQQISAVKAVSRTPNREPRTANPEPNFTVNTGKLTAHFSQHALIDSLVLDGTTIATRGRLVCTTQDQPHADLVDALHYRHYESQVQSTVIERQGSVRTVVRIDGTLTDGQRQWLPFTIRLYFTAGSPEVRMVHTITYDGQQDQDYIHGLGIRFDVPMREQCYNRHVAFATQDGGVWAESVQPLSGRRLLNNDPNLEVRQVAGERIPEPQTFNAAGQELLHHWARWNSFLLSQPTDQGFSITKRAHSNNPWIGTHTGTRAPGYAFVGDVSGGLGLSLQDFWQSYPAALQVDSAATQSAQLTCWLWSPYAPAMNLCHYDNIAHDLNASYEDVQPGMSTPYGIARTSTLTLLPQTGYPGRQAIAQQAQQQQSDSPLLPTPQYLHDRQAFGIWSLPRTDTPNGQKVETLLTQYLDYYLQQQDQHHWYGFWNYGDFMHQYDPARHSWKYDVGGFAWDNTELASISWLWYSFLRTGRADIWKLALAMSRHVSEVDVYHIGPMQGLGSRHNVSHWGCGAKEARISQAAWNRFLYYLTADERMGDLMTDVRDADQKLYTIDPMRLAMPRDKYPCTAPARLRIGPDWLAYAGNWMTEWERTGNPVYRKKIEAGMQSISRLPRGIFTGPGVLGFDPATGILSWEGDPTLEHTNHLMSIMGGFEICLEMMQMLPNRRWQQTWLDYCSRYHLLNSFRVSRVEGYAAWQKHDKSLAADTWNRMWNYNKAAQHYEFDSHHIQGPAVPQPIDESPLTTTNDCALWSLDAIFLQEVIPME